MSGEFGHQPSSDIEMSERAEDIAVASASLSEIESALRPHYDAIRDRLLSGGVLDAVASADYDYTQAKADKQLLEGFGGLLPPATTRGSYAADYRGGGVDEYIEISSSDLYTINAVRAHVLGISHDETGVLIYEPQLYFGFIVGACAMANDEVELLLVKPKAEATYTRKEDGDVPPKQITKEPRLVRTSVSKKAFSTIESFVNDAENTELTFQQVLAMRRHGSREYVLPVPGIPFLVLDTRGEKNPNIKRALKHGIKPLGEYGPGGATVAPVGPEYLMDRSLGDYKAERHLTTLAAAFDVTEGLKKLLIKRAEQF